MNVDEAVDYLWNHKDAKLREVARLLLRLPTTEDGHRLLPGDLLEPKKEVDYLCGFIGEPVVVLRVHYILNNGQHVSDEVSNYSKGKK